MSSVPLPMLQQPKRRRNESDIEAFLKEQRREKTLSELLLDGPERQPERALVPVVSEEAHREADKAEANGWSWRAWRAAPSEAPKPHAVAVAPSAGGFTLNVIYAINEAHSYIHTLVSNLRQLEKTDEGSRLLYEAVGGTEEVVNRDCIASSIAALEQFVALGKCASRLRYLRHSGPAGLKLSVCLDQDEKDSYALVHAWLTSLRVAVAESLAAIKGPNGGADGTD